MVTELTRENLDDEVLAYNGRVLVDFIIDQKGKVTDVKVAKGVDELLDAEAVRVISSSPDWKPAVMGGKKVKCAMSVYVDFKLQKRK